MTITENSHLFAWRAKTNIEEELSFPTCLFCHGKIKVDVIEERNDIDGRQRWVSNNCTVCGWGYASYRNTDVEFVGAGVAGVPNSDWNSVKELRVFDISSSEVALTELGTHLKRRYSDIYALDARRFEELIADVFSEQKKDTVLTQRTRDGGVDVFLRDRLSGEVDTVIECKRYAQYRTVGIAAVQRSAGVALEWQAKKAIVVTSSQFTASALQSARNIARGGVVGMDLVDATDLLKLLGVYNDKLPPLQLITPEIREEISNVNSK